MDDEKRIKSFLEALGAANLKKERERQEFMPIAQHIRNYYECFLSVGFNPDQAMELTLSMVDYIAASISGGSGNV